MGKYLKQIFICSLILSFGLVSTCLSASDTIDENKESKKASVEQAGKEQSNPQEKDNKAEGETKADSLKSAFVFFPEPVFEFASEVEGAEVVHDFVIMNKGTDILKVEKVKTG